MHGHLLEWRKEHANFGRLLDALGEALVTGTGDGAPDWELMLDVLHYLTHYPDRFHHPVEDELYAALRHRRPEVGPVVERLRGMHRRIAANGRDLRELVQGATAGAMLPRRLVAGRAWAYISRYRRHMRMEEELLLPLARRDLAAADWGRLSRQRPDDPLFGRALAREYRALHAAIAAGIGCDCATA